MATCPVCSGMCEIPTGRYQPCYSCGGRGYGSSTDVPCMACGGSGTSTQEITDPCYHCHGTGIIDDPIPASRPRQSSPASAPKPPTPQTSTLTGKKSKSTSGGNAATQTRSATKDKPDSLFAIIAAIFAGILGYTHFEQTQNTTESLFMAAILFVAGYVALYVLYFVVKLAIELLKIIFVIVFWGGVALVIGNLLGLQLAADITVYLEALWRLISANF